MKVAFIIEHLDPRRGGMERSAVDFLTELVELGPEVHVVTQTSAWGHPEIQVHALGVSGWTDAMQYWSFVSLRDEIRGIRLMLEDESMSGAYNLTAPNPATNREMTEAMADVVHRPAFAHVPRFVLKTVLGEMSSEVLGSIRALPTRLLEHGFTFLDPTIEDALATAYADRTGTSREDAAPSS